MQFITSTVPVFTSGNQKDFLVGNVVGLGVGSGVVVVVLVVVVVDEVGSKNGGVRLGHAMSSQVKAQQHPTLDPNK